MRPLSTRLPQALWGRLYVAVITLLFPVAIGAALVLRRRFHPRSVVHIGELRHIQHQFVTELRRVGIRATYIGLGDNPHWDQADLKLPHLANPVAAALRDLRVLFTVVARHEVVHCHCLMGISHYQWEFWLLKLMGRRIVGHVRGCEGRQPDLATPPERNICAECDYRPAPLCLYRENRRRRSVMSRLADAILVTTPDLLDHWPQARHLRFFLPADPGPAERPTPWTPSCGRPLELLHVTNQPGIEGSETIRRVVETLAARGHPIRLRHLTGVPHAEVMAACATADLAIGKMKMGYYANAQLESMLMGVPTITWVRPDLLTADVVGAGFILSELDQLEATLEAILADPAILARAAARSRGSIQALHASGPILRQLEEAYGWR